MTDQKIADQYAIYNGDCVEVLKSLPDGKVHMSVYSPPFAQQGGGALYSYSSNPRDFSNADTYPAFFEQYGFLLDELHRVTMPGRMTGVHCTDVPSGNTGTDSLRDFPGDIIRLHEAHGWHYLARYHVWKEPFGVYIRTMQKNLRHCTVVTDASKCSCASADYLLMFRRSGTNPVPVEHEQGLTEYVGSREVPARVLRYRAHVGKQTANKYSQWVWRQYASAFWDDVRIDRVIPFVEEGKDTDDEKHVHPLQMDVIERCVALWSNPGETVLSPFAGIGSEPFGAVINGRRGIGIELKPSYYRQMIKSMAAAVDGSWRRWPGFAAQSEIRRGTDIDESMDDEDTDGVADAPRGRIRDAIDPPPDRGLKPKHEMEIVDDLTLSMFGK